MKEFKYNTLLSMFFSKSVALWDICSNDLTVTLQPGILFLVGKNLIKPGVIFGTVVKYSSSNFKWSKQSCVVTSAACRCLQKFGCPLLTKVVHVQILRYIY